MTDIVHLLGMDKAAVRPIRTLKVARLPSTADRLPRKADATRAPEDRDRLPSIASRMPRLGAWTADLDDHVLHLSNEACAIHGLPDGATLALRDARQLYSSRFGPSVEAAFAACVTHGTSFELEVEILASTGDRVPMLLSGEAFRGANGRIERIHGAVEDVSVLRHAQVDAERASVRLAETLERLTDAFYTLDRDWRFTYVNPEAARIQQRTRAELIGRSVWDVFPEAVGTTFDIEFHRAMATGETVVFESYYPPLDLWASVRAFPSEDGLAVYYLDIKDRKAAELALIASEKRSRALFERAGDAILLADDTGRWVDANAAASMLLGVPREALIGRNLNDFVIDVLDGVAADAGWQAFLAAGEMRGEVRLRGANGRVCEAEFVAVANISPGMHLSILRDISERRDHERSTVRREHILDALRRLTPGDDPLETSNRICAEIVEQGPFPSAAIYGFGAEDRVTALGAALPGGAGVSALPPLSAGRIDGLRERAAAGPWVEELEGPDDGSARAIIARLGIRSIAFAPIVSDGLLLALLVAGADEPAAELERRTPALVEFAALAASLLGPGLRRRSERAAERGRIRSIIADEAFRPVFQPIIDMTTAQVIGFEALTRFADGTPPDEVFREAADLGLGLELEAATIDAVVRASESLPADAFLGINVSPDMVIAGEPLRSLLPRSTRRVVLEMTEHVRIEDYAILRAAVATLGDDMRFAVDDAGAGFASLRHILELAPSHVKLDRGIVGRIDTDPARQALVAGMVHFAAAIGATLIAEGVETVGERDALLELGVRVGQGYLLGRPAPAAEAACPSQSPARRSGRCHELQPV